MRNLGDIVFVGKFTVTITTQLGKETNDPNEEVWYEVQHLTGEKDHYKESDLKDYQDYAISTSDGHNEDWTYYETKEEAYKAFESMKELEDDIHLYQLTKDLEYEVIDSYWVGDLD